MNSEIENKETDAPKISIIVPVYNVEQYLRRCLDSIAAQTFTDWECILIDDGSPDNSGAICDEYAAKDERFRVIHQKNAGVSAARNAGLDAARGEWIGFVDSDDWVDAEMLSSLYNTAIQQNAEVVVSGDIRTDGKTQIEKFCPDLGWMNMPKDFAIYWQGPCAKLFNKTVLHKNNIKFPLGIALAEDLLFTFKVFFYCKKIYGINYAYYYYFFNQKSAVHTITKEKIKNEEQVLTSIEEILKNKNSIDEWYDFLKAKRIRCKNKYIMSLEQPDFKEWRNYHPELNKDTSKEGKIYTKIYFMLARYGFDKLGNIMFKIKKSLR